MQYDGHGPHPALALLHFAVLGSPANLDLPTAAAPAIDIGQPLSLELPALQFRSAEGRGSHPAVEPTQNDEIQVDMERLTDPDPITDGAIAGFGIGALLGSVGGAVIGGMQDAGDGDLAALGVLGNIVVGWLVGCLVGGLVGFPVGAAIDNAIE